MRFIKIIFLLLLAIATVIFSLSNRDLVTMNLFPFPFKIDTPLFIVIIASIAFGYLLSVTKYYFTGLRKRRDNYLCKQKIKALENEIEGMKTDDKIKASI